MVSDGVSLNLVSRQKLTAMTQQEKIRFILDEVKQNRILVLEQGLSPAEEAKLIETTMVEIDPDTFIGIELESQRVQQKRGRIIGRRNVRTRATMTVVGPADKLRTVRKDGSTIETMVLTGQPAKVAG